MGGGISFREALDARLNIIKPSSQQVLVAECYIPCIVLTWGDIRERHYTGR